MISSAGNSINGRVSHSSDIPPSTRSCAVYPANLIILLVAMLVFRRCLIPNLVHSRRPTPWPSSATTAPSSPSSPSSCTLPRRWPYKRIVALDGLIEELGIICTSDGFASFSESGIFYQCVSFDITRPPIQVQMQVLDITVLGEALLQIFFTRFLMNIRHQYNPAFDRPYRKCSTTCLGCIFTLGGGGVIDFFGGGSVVNVHVGHAWLLW